MLTDRYPGLRSIAVGKLYPGVLIALMAGICAEAISLHYGVPGMLIALLIGLALHFVYDLEKVRTGIDWSARTLLRLGVALLGLNLAFSDMKAIGLPALLLVIGTMIVTMLAGLFGARALGLPREFGLLSGGAVAVCGASAAAAISSVLPKSSENERHLAMTIAVVTLMATVAMIFYPIILSAFALSPAQTAVILGGTIHDVAQVVAAGQSVSADVGELATFVKLMRVAMLVPIVTLVFFAFRDRRASATQSPSSRYLPGFLIVFLFLAALNTMGLIPAGLASVGASVSHYGLIVAIAALGVRTDLRSVLNVGWRPFALIVSETLIMFAAMVCGVLAIN